ncbi:MAG TPA: RluA family pseudouridine synthase [Dongiaceae bacterium]|nr:RluA family pseudouridine synthase [Dongiaceae bacterium]
MATKNIKREALKVLKEFEVAGDLSTTAEVSSYKEVQPRVATRLIWVVFQKVAYVIVFDDAVEDDTELLLEIIQASFPGTKGKFIANPHEDSFKTYGVRHKFRDTYVLEVVPSMLRLDKELARRYPDLSRSTIQKYIKAGYVAVDGKPIAKASADVSDVDDIAVEIPAKEDFSDREFPIIYIDDSVIVINKPEGVLTHSKGVMNDEFTVADFFRRYTTYGLATSRPGIVHRLDRDTSGVIIGARTDEAALLLKKQFADRTVKKYYTAVVDGVPKLEKAVIDLPIGRNPTAPSTFRVEPNGKPAITAYEMVKTNGTRSFVELRPKTGRTHQLRVHMQYIHAPISGDRVYGNVKSAPRLCLHAHSLELTLPGSHRKTFTAPVPALFTELVS